MKDKKPSLPTLYIESGVVLQDNEQWTNRFEIKSESSNRIYVVSQNKKKRHWGCSCMGWKRFRHCKHLGALNLPAYEKPFEVQLQIR